MSAAREKRLREAGLVEVRPGFGDSGRPVLCTRRGLGTVGLQEMELLELFADQAAIALDIVQSARAARAALEGSGQLAVVARVAAALDGLEGERREAGERLLAALEDILGEPSTG